MASWGAGADRQAAPFQTGRASRPLRRRFARTLEVPALAAAIVAYCVAAWFALGLLVHELVNAL